MEEDGTQPSTGNGGAAAVFLLAFMRGGSRDWPTPWEAALASSTHGNAGEDATQETAGGADEETMPELLTRGEGAAPALMPNAEGVGGNDADDNGKDARPLMQAPLTQEPETPALPLTQESETPALQGEAPIEVIDGLLTQAQEVEPRVEPVGGGELHGED